MMDKKYKSENELITHFMQMKTRWNEWGQLDKLKNYNSEYKEVTPQSSGKKEWLPPARCTFLKIFCFTSGRSNLWKFKFSRL